MKANEFVKKFGWDVAIKLSNEMTGITQDVADCVACWGQSEWDCLKRLVDSYELVESYGGLGESKEYIYHHGEYEAVCDENGSVCDYVSNSELIEAIADFESCL